MIISPSKRVSSPENIQEECRVLLRDLKHTIETLLISQVSNVWNIFGGLNRLYPIVLKIFKHRCRVFNQTGEPDIWSYIQGLCWLQPGLAASPSFVLSRKNAHLNPSPNRHYDKASAWVYKSLEAHNLSQKLSWLLSDREHVLSHYESTAFLAQLNYSEAMLICLRALEQNQISFLADINSSLYQSTHNIQLMSKTHRRCSSSPEVSASQKLMWPEIKPKKSLLKKVADLKTAKLSENDNFNISTIEYHDTDSNCEEERNMSRESKVSSNFKPVSCSKLVHNLKKSVSLPDLFKIRDSRSVNSSAASSTQISRKLWKKPRSVTVPNSPSKFGGNSSYKVLSPVSFDSLLLPELDKTCENFLIKHNNNSQKHSTPVKIKAKEFGKENFFIPLCDSSQPVFKKTCKYLKSKQLTLPSRIWEESDDKNSIISGKYSISSSSSISLQQTHKKSFLEDAGKSAKYMKSGYSFSKPSEGQSLFSFLSSSPFGRGDAELDRENAHFYVADAVIAAIEQVKCNYELNTVNETVDESDEEINHLKQRIRLRRKQKAQERTGFSITPILLGEIKTETSTTDQSNSSVSPSSCSTSGSISTDDVDDLDIEQIGNLTHLNQSGLSISMGSLYSEAELQRPSPPSQSDSVKSAESIALSLLRRFKKKQLPAASEVEWLVSEQTVNQQLLPFPTSWPVSPDEAEDQDMTHATQLRGTTEWAPPRSPIIFTIHPNPVRRILMAKQNFRCAGCGAKVDLKYIQKYRYCEYLGRYFCTSCHTNQTAVLPSKVLNKWDFSKCLVSDFSFHLLEQLSSDPLFNIQDQFPNLYKKARGLEKIRELRWQLCLMKTFLMNCRFAANVQNLLQDLPDHVLDDPEIYSLQDLIETKKGDLLTRLKNLTDIAFEHLATCQLCEARGFICELCHDDEILFPWELNKVCRCHGCGACYHKKCFSPSHTCRRCMRISDRQKQKTISVDVTS